jgi:hypothetical protein
MVDLNAGTIQTVAGSGSSSFNQKEGSAFEVDLNQPSGLFLGPTGTIYIADTQNHRIRELTIDYTTPTTPELPPEDAVADFNGDDQIDFLDFLLFASAFGSAQIDYDLDGDGTVGFSDFLAFVQIYERNQAGGGGSDQAVRNANRQ